MKLDYTKITSVEIDGVDHNDYPDYVDAFISNAEYNGKEMTDEEIDDLNDNHTDFVQEEVFKHLH